MSCKFTFRKLFRCKVAFQTEEKGKKMVTQEQAIKEVKELIASAGYKLAMTDREILQVYSDYGNNEIVAMNCDMLAGMSFGRAINAQDYSKGICNGLD